MVLISGTGNVNNRSILPQTNDERSKAPGVTVTVINNSHHQGNKSAQSGRSHLTVLNNSHQQENKSVESGRTQSSLNASLIKGMTTMDEFKYGFPSQGLSTTSNKWWGSSKREDCAGTDPDRAKSQLEERAREADKVACETGNAENSETPQGAALLTAVRKRALEEDREALKLGVFQGYGVNKLGTREKILLRRIFRTSLPMSWMHDL